MKCLVLAACVSFAALLLLPSLRPRGTDIVFAPEEGLVLQKTAEATLGFELSELTMTMGGEDMTPEDTPEVSERSWQRTVFTDTYVSVDDGVVFVLERSYDELAEGEVTEGTPDADEDSEYGSPLEGVTVIFSWDEDEEEYALAFGESEEDLDEELLVDLDHNDDFTLFLPDGEVEEGESWEFEVEGPDGTLSFAGDLKFERDEEEDEEDDLVEEAMEENLTVAVTCTFKGERDGIAVIEIEGEGRGEADKENDEEADGTEITTTDTVSFEVSFEGELLWDLEAGYFTAFSLSGEIEFTMTQVVFAEFEGETSESEFVMEFTGDFVQSYEAETP